MRANCHWENSEVFCISLLNPHPSLINFDMKYIDADKLIATLERQNADKKIIQPLIHIIDSLQQEQQEELVSDDLEEATDEYQLEIKKHILDGSPIGTAKDAFRAGAEWQKRKMMEGAVEWMVTTNLANCPVIYLDQLKGFQYGDKVKIIVVKEEE